MPVTLLTAVLLALSAAAYQVGKRRALATGGGRGSTRALHSRPAYYGMFVAVWCLLPALAVLLAWNGGETSLVTRWVVAELPAGYRELPPDRLGLVVNDIRNLAAGVAARGDQDPALLQAAERYNALHALSRQALTVVALLLAAAGTALGWRLVAPRLRARNHVETVVRVVMIACSTFAIFTTVGIVLSVVFESIRFFRAVPVTEFLFGLNWSPQIALRADQVGGSGAFGAVPLFVGTLLVSAIAMAVAVPVGLLSAIYLSEFAAPRVRATAKPLLEILAGIPTVVYGFFAALTVAPFLRDVGGVLGLDVASESALAAGLVMGIMIIPFVSSLADDVIHAVPQALRDGSLALGATRAETVQKVIFPAALPGIVGGILLAISRAIGETMIVVMAAGLAANLTANPLDSVTTVTVQIVTLLVGDQEFDSPKTLAAFALGLVLFVVTLVLNVIALQVVRRYREQYE
ncbi:MAG TPA: phosphate ABC transporter permease subunit PstC [Gammaproteobacteria bacterium]